jgi:hypothetical protein
VAKYNLTFSQAGMLLGFAQMEPEERLAKIAQFFPGSHHELMILLSEFMSLSISVVESNREMTETLLITEGNMHPYQAEKINQPTIQGALNGRMLADGIDQEKLCEGCAFRIGAPANHCLSTTSDADWCIEDQRDHFYCHMEMDENGQPLKACAGYAIKLKQKQASLS